MEAPQLPVVASHNFLIQLSQSNEQLLLAYEQQPVTAFCFLWGCLLCNDDLMFEECYLVGLRHQLHLLLNLNNEHYLKL